MTRTEAENYAERIRQHAHLSAEVIRILPFHLDPPRPGDNGWDVQVTDNTMAYDENINLFGGLAP